MAATSLRTQIVQALGKRVTLRLHEGDGTFRDIVGVLQSETSLIDRRGKTIHFNPDEVAVFRIIPVFNRRDVSHGQLSIYDTMTRKLQAIQGHDGVVTMYCCGPTVYRDAHVGNLPVSYTHLRAHETG
jgi:cysteinyl-tRNA synthetase